MCQIKDLLSYALLVLSLHVQAEVVILKGERSGYLGDNAQILSNVAQGLTPEEALRLNGFAQSTAEVPNLGLSEKEHWLKLDLKNQTGSEALVLNVAHADIDLIEVFQRQHDGSFKLIGRGGLLTPNDSRYSRDKENSFDISIPHNTTSSILIRVGGNKQIQIPITVSTPNSYFSDKTIEKIVIGIYIGIMLTLSLYNLFIYMSMRDNSYLLYVLYILTVGLTQLAFTGVGPFYVWGDLVWFSERSTVILTLLTAILASEFLIVFIHTKNYLPNWKKWSHIFYIAIVGCALLSIANLPLHAYKATQVISGVFASALLGVVFRVWRKGSREAGYFLLAWSVFLVGTVLFVMKDMGFLPYNAVTLYTMPIGSAIEGILLSFGLADRINVLRREKERSQAEALRALEENERLTREQNVVLEQKVKQRTAALQESNDTLKRTQAQLVSAEKMASLGQLTAGIAHEINNPINFISSNVPPLRRNMQDLLQVLHRYQQLKPGDGPEVLAEIRALEQRLDLATTLEEMEEIVASIAEGSSRTAEIVRGLRNFSRLDEDDLKDADINEGLRSTLAVLSPQFRDKVAIELDLQATHKVECFPGKVNQVFMNIITNAVQATIGRPGDRPRVVHIRTASTDDRVQVTISDNGVGMSAEVIERIYDPFFTTKPVGEGTGLGMAIVYGIIQDHQGSIQVESSPGVGTTFNIELPTRHHRMASSAAEAA